MEEKKKNSWIIILFAVIGVILIALIILFATRTINFDKKSTIESNDILEENNINENTENDNNSTYTVNSMTSAKFNIFWDGTEHEINVIDGALVVEGNTFSIPNERIKYFYYNRYQCSHGTVLYYLTEEGNIYVTDMSPTGRSISPESLNDFKKLNYSNVTDIVVIPNDNYGKPLDEVSGKTDNIREYLYALVNGETFKLDYQYRC